MSLIGEKVKATKFSNHNVEGVVLDRFMGITMVCEHVPSGKGGTIKIDKYINVDMYLVLTDSGKIETIKCSDIFILNN